MTTEDNLNADMFRAIFDAIPSFAFVVDDDLRIQEYNVAAAELLSGERATILKRRGGEVLYCLHSIEVSKGCGRGPFCKECVVRNSVSEAFQGSRVVRRRTKLEILRDEEKIEIYALVTATPFYYMRRPFALLIVEDISEITELKRMIPICSICKKVRDDKESWLRIEAYFKNNLDLDFSHGYCPECFKKEMAKIK